MKRITTIITGLSSLMVSTEDEDGRRKLFPLAVSDLVSATQATFGETFAWLSGLLDEGESFNQTLLEISGVVYENTGTEEDPVMVPLRNIIVFSVSAINSNGERSFTVTSEAATEDLRTAVLAAWAELEALTNS